MSSNEIAQLLELQSIDQQLTEEADRIRRLKRERERYEQKIAEAKQAFAQLQEDQHQLEHNSLMRNLEVDELDANIRNYQHRLDTGIISFKEMEDLRAKIILEKKRIGEMEDEALAMMDAITDGKAGLVSAEAALDERIKELNVAISEIDDHTQQATSAINDLETQRTSVLESMSEFEQSRYEALHRKFRNPIAIIDHATCSGCKLKLSASTIERARGGLGIVSCEHCARVVYTD